MVRDNCGHRKGAYYGSPQPIRQVPNRNCHSDHAIESQHHGKNEFNMPKFEDYANRKMMVHKPDHKYDDKEFITTRREPKKHKVIEGFYPKQEIMLVNVDSEIKQYITYNFVYTDDINVSRDISIGDIIRVFYIQKTEDDQYKLTETIGKVFDIDFGYKEITIDYSEQFEAFRITLTTEQIRFISNDLSEAPPFLEYHKQEEVKYEEPIVLEKDKEEAEEENYCEGIVRNQHGYLHHPIDYRKPFVTSLYEKPEDEKHHHHNHNDKLDDPEFEEYTKPFITSVPDTNI